MAYEGITQNPMDADLVASNIKDAVSVFGVTGNLKTVASNPGGGGVVAGYLVPEQTTGSDYYSHGYFDWLRFLFQYETSTHVYYFFEYYRAGGSGTYYNNLECRKVNKITKVVTKILGPRPYYNTSGGSVVAAAVSTTTDNAGMFAFLYGTDGKCTFNATTDTWSTWDYARLSNNKTGYANGTVPVQYTFMNDANYILTLTGVVLGQSMSITCFIQLQ